MICTNTRVLHHVVLLSHFGAALKPNTKQNFMSHYLCEYSGIESTHKHPAACKPHE